MQQKNLQREKHFRTEIGLLSTNVMLCRVWRWQLETATVVAPYQDRTPHGSPSFNVCQTLKGVCFGLLPGYKPTALLCRSLIVCGFLQALNSKSASMSKVSSDVLKEGIAGEEGPHAVSTSSPQSRRHQRLAGQQAFTGKQEQFCLHTERLADSAAYLSRWQQTRQLQEQLQEQQQQPSSSFCACALCVTACCLLP